MKANVMYLVQMDVIMWGEYTGKGFEKKMFVQQSHMVLGVWWYEDTWQSQELEIFILSKALWTTR